MMAAWALPGWQSGRLFAQPDNLVPNASFEQLVVMNRLPMFEDLFNWYNPEQFPNASSAGSPELAFSPAGGPGGAVDVLYGDYCAWINAANPNQARTELFDEAVAVALKAPLEPGKRYDITIAYRNAPRYDANNIGTRGLGVFDAVFGLDSMEQIQGDAPSIGPNDQLVRLEGVTYAQTWQDAQATFIADKAYTHLMLGLTTPATEHSWTEPPLDDPDPAVEFTLFWLDSIRLRLSQLQPIKSRDTLSVCRRADTLLITPFAQRPIEWVRLPNEPINHGGADSLPVSFHPTDTLRYRATNGLQGDTAWYVLLPIGQEPPNPFEGALPTDTTFCGPFSLELFPQVALPAVGVLYWTDGYPSLIRTVTEPGTYTLKWTASSRCDQVIDSIVVSADFLTVTGNTESDTLCPSDYPMLLSATAEEAVSWRWTTGDTTASLAIQEAGRYGVWALGKAGCRSDTLWFERITRPGPALAWQLPESPCPADEVRIVGVNGTARWADGTPGNTRPVGETGLRTYTATVENACTTRTESQSLEVGLCAAVTFPTAFSPNGDGQNETVQPYIRGVASGSWEVFDRWGNRVFQSTSLTDAWSPTQLPEGVYVYRFSGISTRNEPIQRNGTLQLMR